MSEAATLKVPARCIKAFQLAVLDEIATDVEAVARDLEERESPEDARASTRNVGADWRLLDQLGTEEIIPVAVRGGAVEVRSDAETLAHAAETMARKILGPKIAEELHTSPIDGELAVELHQLAEDLAWAIESARLLHGQADAERAARAEVA